MKLGSTSLIGLALVSSLSLAIAAAGCGPGDANGGGDDDDVINDGGRDSAINMTDDGGQLIDAGPLADVSLLDDRVLPPGDDAGCLTVTPGTPPFPRRCAPSTLNECDTATDTSLNVGMALRNGLSGNGFDDDCDGQVDEGCELIVSGQIFINGDCLCSIPCPAVAPHPVGCNIIMQGGDPKGCIGVNKLEQVYFQEADQCGEGTVTGTLICSSKPGPGLNAQNCPINKPVPLYLTPPSQCPYEGGFFDPGPDPCRDF